jgi:hypothetical protein
LRRTPFFNLITVLVASVIVIGLLAFCQSQQAAQIAQFKSIGAEFTAEPAASGAAQRPADNRASRATARTPHSTDATAKTGVQIFAEAACATDDFELFYSQFTNCHSTYSIYLNARLERKSAPIMASPYGWPLITVRQNNICATVMRIIKMVLSVNN